MIITDHRPRINHIIYDYSDPDCCAIDDYSDNSSTHQLDSSDWSIFIDYIIFFFFFVIFRHKVPINLRKDLQFVFYIRTTDHYWRGIIFHYQVKLQII